MTATRLALAAVVCALALPAAAQDPLKPAAGAERPKVCLVLSGGGARGAAHVGVIKVLEELRVPVHCIVGTSMGSLVGGAYASGMSVAEMEQLIAGLSTDLLFHDQPERYEQSMRRKLEDYQNFVGPELGLGKGRVTLGKGFVTGVQLESVLRRLSKIKGYIRYDDLPIPFRAVATDLVSGKIVVFSEGELANAMRASMSVPGAVAPAENSEWLLVDGMLTSNLPVETARAMGADVVIAVNVGTPLLKRDEIRGILGVVGQMLGILTDQNVQASLAALKPDDILITPELEGVSTGDFDDLPKIAPRGEAAARKMAERLARLAVPAGEYAALRSRQQVAIAPDLRPVDEIRFENLRRVNPIAVRSVMETQTGRPLEQDVLDGDMRRIYGMGNFERVRYRFLEEPDRRVLLVDAAENSWGMDALRFGLGLESDFSGESNFNVLGSYRKYWLNSLGGEWRTDVQVGTSSSFTSEFYQPLEAQGRFFVAPHVSVARRSVPLYQGDHRVAIYDLSSRLAGADVGAQFARYGELRLGMVWGTLNPDLETGPQNLSPGAGSYTQGAYRARLVLDQIDSVQFPRAGWKVGAALFNSTSQLGAEDSYTKADADGSAAYTFGEHTINIGGKAGGRIGDDRLPRYDQYQWGGFLRQSGYQIGQLYGENIQYARAMYYQRIKRSTLLEGAYGGFSLEVGKVGNQVVAGGPDGTLKSASVFVAADTPVGPAYFAYGRATDGNSSFYVYIGRAF